MRPLIRWLRRYPALEVSEQVDLETVPIGLQESGEPWKVEVLGTHMLVAGMTGAGKGSVFWSLPRGTRRPKKRPVSVYRLTRGEVVALMEAAQTTRERRVVFVGVLAGLRNQDLRGLQRHHFERDGAIWVASDIAKGRRERFVPVLTELEPIVADILRSVGPSAYVIAAQRSVGGLRQVLVREVPSKPSSPPSILRLVDVVARRSGIGAHIYPHLLRHAYGDQIARYEATLGHASIDTTVSTYTGAPSLDELAVSLAGFRYRDGRLGEQMFYPAC